MILCCPKCHWPMETTLFPVLTHYCQNCRVKYTITFTMSDTTTALYRPIDQPMLDWPTQWYKDREPHEREAIPKAFADAFAGEELEP